MARRPLPSCLAGVLVLLLGLQLDPPSCVGQELADQLFQDQRFERVHLIELDGPIFGRFHWFLNEQLDAAQQGGADLIILNLTSPGGDLEQSLQLARRLRDIEWAETVAYIPTEAISGGAMISLGCDRIVMKRGALIGDAGPIKLGLEGFEHADQKIVSYLTEALGELAQAKGRPETVVQAMADRSLVIYEATEKATGETVYLTQSQVDLDADAGRYDVGQQLPETGRDRFLTVAADRAMELQLCEATVASEQDLLDGLAIDNLQRTQINWVDKTVYLLNQNWLTAILLVAGLIGIYFELAAPGISVAGLFAMLCFGIFFWSHVLGGTAGWLEIVLFLLGVVCLIFEIFVLPGFGIFGLSGLVLIVFSLVMASQDFVIPETTVQWDTFQTNLLVVLGAVLGVTVLLFGQIFLLDSIPGFNRFRLAAPEAVEETPLPANSDAASAYTPFAAVPKRPVEVGEIGIADSDLRPSGKIKIEDHLYDVVTEGDYVDAGSQVEVMRRSGNHIVVRRLDS